MSNLILHKGAKEVQWDEITKVATPQPTQNWHPVPHDRLVDTMREVLKTEGQAIVREQHALNGGGARYFGIIHLAPQEGLKQDFGLVLGIRNSHDQTFSASVCAGSSVFVCDNLAFNGEVKLARKHTRHIMRDLPQLTSQALGQLRQVWTGETERIARYKAQPMDRDRTNNLLIGSIEVGAITPSMLPRVMEDWKRPPHPEFSEQNAWSLYNAFTGVLREQSFELIQKRTTALTGLFDNVLFSNN